MSTTMLIDSCGRAITYLRISVTGHCDLCCLYCRSASPGAPAGGSVGPGWHWTADRLAALASAAVAEGITRIRLTGGEPLLRPDLPELIAELVKIPGLQDLGLTTNGQLLAERAEALAEAGLRRINISLDSLDPETFKRITGGGDLQRTLAGLRAAQAAGFGPIKINTVLLRGYNDHEVQDLAALAREEGLHVRLIELMPIGPAAALSVDLFRPAGEALAGLGVGADVRETAGAGPARAWRLGRGSLGIVTAVSDPPCGSCNRMRVASDGFLRPCLTNAVQVDLRDAFSTVDPVQALRMALRQGVALKPPAGGHLRDGGVPALAMCAVGG